MFLITAEKGIRGNGSETPGKFLESHLHIRNALFEKRGHNKKDRVQTPKALPQVTHLILCNSLDDPKTLIKCNS